MAYSDEMVKVNVHFLGGHLHGRDITMYWPRKGKIKILLPNECWDYYELVPLENYQLGIWRRRELIL